MQWCHFKHAEALQPHKHAKSRQTIRRHHDCVSTNVWLICSFAWCAPSHRQFFHQSAVVRYHCCQRRHCMCTLSVLPLLSTPPLLPARSLLSVLPLMYSSLVSQCLVQPWGLTPTLQPSEPARALDSRDPIIQRPTGQMVEI